MCKSTVNGSEHGLADARVLTLPQALAQDRTADLWVDDVGHAHFRIPLWASVSLNCLTAQCTIFSTFIYNKTASGCG